MHESIPQDTGICPAHTFSQPPHAISSSTHSLIHAFICSMSPALCHPGLSSEHPKVSPTSSLLSGAEVETPPLPVLPALPPSQAITAHPTLIPIPFPMKVVSTPLIARELPQILRGSNSAGWPPGHAALSPSRQEPSGQPVGLTLLSPPSPGPGKVCPSGAHAPGWLRMSRAIIWREEEENEKYFSNQIKLLRESLFSAF